MSKIQKQETEKTIQFGIQFPNGDVSWDSYDRYSCDISTEKGRQDFLDHRKREMTQLRIPEIGKIKFLKRIIKVSYSEPEVFETE